MTENTVKSVVITGASRGIGKACALLLDRLGFKIFAGVRRIEDGEQLKKQSTGNIVPVIIDVTDKKSIEIAARDIASMLNDSGLYGLVNNAGIAVGGPLEFMPIERIREQFEINVFGQISITQQFLPLIRKGKGRIINISSKEGMMAMPFIGPYCASKFALEAFSDALRMELKHWDIPVSIIEPGTIATQIIERSIASAEECVKELPRHANELYESCFNSARKAADKILKSAIPVDAAARIVLKALTDKKPKTRYTVGLDAKAISVMCKILPDRMLDKIILKQMGMG
jgi:NAD(P)-dependent dehydrogenase (short-subunit alcohol dehydrogenase family)